MTNEGPKAEIPGNEIRAFFDRPGNIVIAEFASSWVRHENRQEIFEGQGRILGIQTPSRVRPFRIEEAVLYRDSYTRERWSNSRGPIIAAMEPGEVVSFAFHTSVLTFIKTQGAENIQLSYLQEVDNLGQPLEREGSVLTAAKIAREAGLEHQSHAQLFPFRFRDEQAFLLSVGGRRLSPDELKQLEEELLSDTNT